MRPPKYTTKPESLAEATLRKAFERAKARRERQTKERTLPPTLTPRDRLLDSKVAAQLVRDFGVDLAYSELQAELKQRNIKPYRAQNIIQEYTRIAKATIDFLEKFGREPRVLLSDERNFPNAFRR